MSNQDYQYDVALSFAGEDRKYAEELAQVLKACDLDIFYDKYEEATLWGKNLYTHLCEVYQKQARFCVMFLSKHYAQKLWTNHEREAAQAHAFQENEEYILPIRLDNTEIPGILPTIGYLKWSDANSIANAIVKKLELRLWVHGWVKQNYGNSPTVELDWTEHFDMNSQPRRIADQATWDNILQPSLIEAREKLPERVVIDVRGLFPLTAAVAIGTVFPDTRGYTLQVEQRTAGKPYLWRSDASPSDAKFNVVQESGEAGEHLLIALGITGNPLLDVAKLLQDSPVPFNAMIYAEPEFGIGERVIRSDADTVALVLDAKDLIRRYRHKYSASCTHLVLYAPVGFCLFLGQRLRVVGDVICYERVADRNYQPSVKLVTG